MNSNDDVIFAELFLPEPQGFVMNCITVYNSSFGFPMALSKVVS